MPLEYDEQPGVIFLRPNLFKILSRKHSSNSGAFKDWSQDVKEDDFYFYPAYLKHKIDPQTSKNKNRITIVLNIILSPKQKEKQ